MVQHHVLIKLSNLVLKVIYAIKDTTLVSKGDEILKEAGIEVEFQFNEDVLNFIKISFQLKGRAYLN